MKILYIALVELEIYNAPRTHTIEVCENLTKLGNKVLLLIPKPQKEKFRFSFNITYVPFFGWGLIRNLIYNFILSFYLIFYIIRFKPDVVYERMLNNPLCLIVTKIFKIKHFLEVNGPPFEKGKFFKNILIKIEIRKTDGIISSSPKIRSLISKEIKIKKNRIKFLPTGVNPKIFYPQDMLKIRETLNIDRDYFYLGYTGTIYWAYDFDFVLEAMDKIKNEIKDIKLLIIGPNIREDCPENVIFIKEVKYEKVPLYINSFDLCLWPRSRNGLAEWGVLSTKLFEYIACGKIVLVPNLDDEEVPDVIKNFIVFYKYNDKEDFLKKIKELYYNRNLLEKKKEEINRFAEEYNWKEITERIVEFIHGEKNENY